MIYMYIKTWHVMSVNNSYQKSIPMSQKKIESLKHIHVVFNGHLRQSNRRKCTH
jgi:hypothetical protein